MQRESTGRDVERVCALIAEHARPDSEGQQSAEGVLALQVEAELPLDRGAERLPEVAARLVPPEQRWPAGVASSWQLAR